MRKFVWAAMLIGLFELGVCPRYLVAKEKSTPQEVFDAMAKGFRADRTEGLHVRYQFDLSGPNGGHWYFDVNNGTLRTNRGKIKNPDVVLMASDNDWVALSNGKLNGIWAFVTGRLKIHGDRGLAKKLSEIFP